MVSLCFGILLWNNAVSNIATAVTSQTNPAFGMGLRGSVRDVIGGQDDASTSAISALSYSIAVPTENDLGSHHNSHKIHDHAGMSKKSRASIIGSGHRHYSDNNNTVTFYANETCGLQTETIVYTTRNTTVTQVSIFQPPCNGPLALQPFDHGASPVNTFTSPVTPSPARSAASYGMGGALPPAVGATSLPQTARQTSAPIPRPVTEGPGTPQATNHPVENPAADGKSVAGVVSAIQTLAQALPVSAEPELGAAATDANTQNAGSQSDAHSGLVPGEPQSENVESVASKIVSHLLGSSGQGGSEPGEIEQHATTQASNAQELNAPYVSGLGAGEPEADGSRTSGSETGALGSSSIGSPIAAAVDVQPVRGAMQDESAGVWNAGDPTSPPSDQSSAGTASYAPGKLENLAKLAGIISDVAGSQSSPANGQAESEKKLTDAAGEEELSSNDLPPGPSVITVGGQTYSAAMSVSQDGARAKEILEEAIVTLGTQVLTAEVLSGPSATLVMLGSETLTLGDPAITMAGETVSTATNGIVVDGLLDAFSTVTATGNGALTVSTSRVTTTEPAASTTPGASNDAGLPGSSPRVFWLGLCSWALFVLG
ncbi:MAG: hypothetical protein Q9165_004858 [Trypethelium subeluteriae]